MSKSTIIIITYEGNELNIITLEILHEITQFERLIIFFESSSTFPKLQ